MSNLKNKPALPKATPAILEAVEISYGNYHKMAIFAI